MSLPNGPEIVAAFLGVVAAGAGAAPLNQAYTAEEFRAYLDDLRPRAMLFLRGEASPARAVCDALGIRQVELAGADTADARRRGPRRRPAPRRRATPTRSRCCCTRAARRASPRACRIRQRNLAASAQTVAAHLRAHGATTSSHCVMPLFHVHGLVASTLATLASGGTRDRAAALLGERVLGRRRRARRDLVLGRADDPPHPALARRGRRRRPRRPRPALRALVLVRAARAAHGRVRGALRAAARRGLRHDRGGTPDGLEPAAAGRAPRGLGGPADGDGDRDPRRRLAPARRPAPSARSCVRGPGVVDGYRDNPEATAAALPRRLVPHRRLRAALGRRLPLARRPPQGADQPRRREDLAARGRGRAARAPRRRRGRRVRGARRQVRRGGRRRGRAARAAVGEDALRAHCDERLAAFKVPARIHVLDAIPKGPTGKVQRRLLAAQLP